MPAEDSAVSKAWDWPLVRNRTAISEAGTPSSISAAIRSATQPASASSSVHSANTRSGPAGRWETSSRGSGQRGIVRSRSPALVRSASRRLAASTICGLDR